MRTWTGGDGSDTSAAVLAYVATHDQFELANLYLIGEAEDPLAIWATDYDRPILWSAWGTFQPAVITRGRIITKIGLSVDPLDITWSPKPAAFINSVAAGSPLTRAQVGYYDNMRVRVWRVLMPTPGDANTLGAACMFAGRIATTEISQGTIKWSVNSYLSILDQKLPANLIEATNTLAGYTASTPVDGESKLPTFAIYTGSTPNVLLGDCLSPTANKIYGDHKFDEGYLVFLDGPGATLSGAWSKIGHQTGFVDGTGNHHNQFQIYAPLPWAPTPAVDKFYVSATAPINLGDASYYGFPYVPSPENAV